jgi:anti-anti-sigma factor
MEMTSQLTSAGVLIVALKGRLDIKATLEIDRSFTRKLQSHPSVILDLSELESLSVLGIRTLILAIKSATMTGHRLVVIGPDEYVHQILTSSGAASLIPVAQTIAQAETMVLNPSAADKVILSPQQSI